MNRDETRKSSPSAEIQNLFLPGVLGGEANQANSGDGYPSPCLQGTLSTPQLSSKLIHKTTRPLRQACIKLNEHQISRLKHDQQLTGKTIPELLRNAYFSRSPLLPLMPHQDILSLHAQFSQIANTMNELAQNLDSGLREGFNPDFEDVKRRLDLMHALIMKNRSNTRG